MSVQHDYESPNQLALAQCFEKLRRREGLTAARLTAASPRFAVPLLSLPAVRRHSAANQVELAHAALAVVRECIRYRLDGAERIITDAVLAADVFADTNYRELDPKVVKALRAELLSTRRRALLINWKKLHEAHGFTSDVTPSDKVLRTNLEERALAELARQLLLPEVLPARPANRMVVSEVTDASAVTHRDASARVIVVGGAVMDATFRTDVLPQLATSREANDFFMSPGGKGLTQAVAAARIGLDVSLITAISDDRFGQEILEHLLRENVDTSMLKVVPNSRSSFTGVIVLKRGDSVAVNWPNSDQLKLDTRHLERLHEDIMSCRAVLITLESPLDIVQQVVAMAHKAPEHRPLIIVTPCNPFSSAVDDLALLPTDYMVAHMWELQEFVKPSKLDDRDAMFEWMRKERVETLCIPTEDGCEILTSANADYLTVKQTTRLPYKEKSVARDAFCAALAARIIEGGNEFSEDIALWATAAMSAAIADYPLPNAMPDRRRIEQLLSRTSFTVTGGR